MVTNRAAALDAAIPLHGTATARMGPNCSARGDPHFAVRRFGERLLLLMKLATVRRP
jgi:hypothetical protein